MQSIFLRQLLTMDNKFSIGFKPDKFPGQSNTIIFIFLKQFVNILALWHGAEALLKNCTWVEVRQFSADFSFDDLQISVAVHHALDRYK